MKISVLFESTLEDDGVSTSTLYTHKDVEDLTSLSWVFAEAARAGGYTYVDRVTFTTKEGRQFESEF